MIKRYKNICLYCISILSFKNNFGQQAWLSQKFHPTLITSCNFYTKAEPTNALARKQFKNGWGPGLSYQSFNKEIKSIATIAPSFASASMGFFCKKELMLDKLTPLPIRFRLGALDYVNWMEQKPNAVRPGR
jgi:hypothetical protein